MCLSVIWVCGVVLPDQWGDVEAGSEGPVITEASFLSLHLSLLPHAPLFLDLHVRGNNRERVCAFFTSLWHCHGDSGRLKRKKT